MSVTKRDRDWACVGERVCMTKGEGERDGEKVRVGAAVGEK